MSNPENIMEDTGKNNKVLLSTDGVFINNDCMFIEYDDVIKSPYFMILVYFADVHMTYPDEIFDLTEIKGLSMDALYEWYTNREHQFILDNFKIREDKVEFKEDDPDGYKWKRDFVYSLYENIEDIVFRDTSLNFVTTMVNIMKHNLLIKKFFVYTERYSKNIEIELLEAFPNINYVHGDLVEVLKRKDITNNSTFVLSDVKKIAAIAQAGKLNFSSVVIADRYEYNYKGRLDELVIPVELLLKDNLFKLDFFDNINS